MDELTDEIRFLIDLVEFIEWNSKALSMDDIQEIITNRVWELTEEDDDD